jgi:hypothetical protein
LEHLLAAERKTGKTPQALLEAPTLPGECGDVWKMFSELHSCRGSTGFGPIRITFMDIDAYQRVTGTRLLGWERDAIEAADDAFLADWASRQPKVET